MGTPDFAVDSLKRLHDDGYKIAGVFTQPDKPRGRGMKLSFSPVKEFAVLHGLPVYQPSSLRNDESVELLRSLECELLVVVAYGKIVPKEILDVPRLGAINIHASLLPKYRGAAPIHWAIMNGETRTGVTSMFINEEIDAGDMLLTKETPIGENETVGVLYDRLRVMGAELLSETIQSVLSNNTRRIPQDHSMATYAPLIDKELARIDWNQSAHSIKCKVRALSPKPAAVANIDGVILKIYEVEIASVSKLVDKLPGEVIFGGKHGLEIACADGSILIKELQAPGGRRMSAADFLRGQK
jgi:methionyl-tRNA formyltransferase